MALRHAAAALLALGLIVGATGCQPTNRWPGVHDVEPCPTQTQPIDVRELADFVEENKCDYEGLELEFPSGVVMAVEPIFVASESGAVDQPNYYVRNAGSYGLVAAVRQRGEESEWFGPPDLIDKVRNQFGGDPF